MKESLKTATSASEEPQFPVANYVQWFVIELTRHDTHSGRYIRERLAEKGERKSPASFYQFMGRMEAANWIAGDYRIDKTSGHTIKERVYRATSDGLKEADKVTALFADPTARIGNIRRQRPAMNQRH